MADAGRLSLEPRRFRTDFGGLFLFVPDLIRLDLDAVVRDSGRPPHIMPDVMDPGLALFAGLSAVPKRSSLTEYSCRVDPRPCDGLMNRWHRSVQQLEVDLGSDGSFDLDFHAIPYHGDSALLEKHCVSKRSRCRKGIPAFLARDADARMPCHASASVRKSGQDDEILRFAEYWKRHQGEYPREPVLDCRLTTHANLYRLEYLDIRFLTLRKRTRRLLDGIRAVPDSDWRRVRLTNVGRAYRTPRVLEQTVHVSGYPKPVRQPAVRDLGHNNPSLLPTNRFDIPAGQLVDRHARRMVIENAIAEAIDLFHMDALSAAVPMKTDPDLQLTLMATPLYRLTALRIGNGRRHSGARNPFRDFIRASADIVIDDRHVTACIGRRANNPCLLAAGYRDIDMPIPWLGNRRLNLRFT